MSTNNYPGVGYRTQGRDYHFFAEIDVSATTFGGNSVDGYQPDCVITFPTQGLKLIIEPTGPNKIVEFSFNGTTLHGKLDGQNTSHISSLEFEFISVSKIWLRIASGSSGPVKVYVYSWGKPY